VFLDDPRSLDAALGGHVEALASQRPDEHAQEGAVGLLPADLRRDAALSQQGPDDQDLVHLPVVVHGSPPAAPDVVLDQQRAGQRGEGRREAGAEGKGRVQLQHAPENGRQPPVHEQHCQPGPLHCPEQPAEGHGIRFRVAFSPRRSQAELGQAPAEATGREQNHRVDVADAGREDGLQRQEDGTAVPQDPGQRRVPHRRERQGKVDQIGSEEQRQEPRQRHGHRKPNGAHPVSPPQMQRPLT
jgi:hypothetical protein